MKRIGAILCLSLLLVLMTTSFSFATGAGLEITDTYPRDGGKGMQLVNTGVKLYFNQPMKSSNAIKADEDCFKFTDEKGNVQPIKVVYIKKDPNQVLVLINKQLAQKATYKLTISKDLMAKSGDTLGKEQTISFTTRDTSVDTKVNMGMMAVMMIGMVVFTSRSAKSHVKKELIAEGKEDIVNPYKVAKETGKSVEEIVAKDLKEKEKHQKKRDKLLAKHEEINAEPQQEVDNGNMRVKAPRKISEGGSTYATGRKAKAEEEAKKRAAAGTTNPKNKGKKRK